MSKLIVDMEMPRNCQECPLSHAYFLYGSKYCGANGVLFEKEYYKSKRPDKCPILGELPKEHGDLVDYDEVEKEFNRLLTYMEEVPDENGIVWFRRETIIPRGYRMEFHSIVPAERKET